MVMSTSRETASIFSEPALAERYSRCGVTFCKRTLLKRAVLVDPEREEVTPHSLVVVDDEGRLEYAGAWDSALASACQGRGYAGLDLNGCLLMPFMVDAHVHLTADLSGQDDNQADADPERTLRRLESTLKDGIGLLRDCGDGRFATLDLRDRLAAAGGPQLLASGPPITTPGGHMYRFGITARGKAALAKAVSRLAEKGVDFIKICATGGQLTPGSDPRLAQYSPAELRAVVDTAAQYGLKVSAHAHGEPGIKACVAAGVQWIEHCSFMRPGGGHWLNEALLDRMAADGITLNFTLSEFKWRASRSELAALEEGRNVQPYSFYKTLLDRARQAGVKLVISSDAGIPSSPFGAQAKRLWAARTIYRLPVWEVLRAVTTTPARLCGITDKPWAKGNLVGLVAVRGLLEGLLCGTYRVERLFFGRWSFPAH
jgi:imidazolonepropionase-like amidohydrolase